MAFAVNHDMANKEEITLLIGNGLCLAFEDEKGNVEFDLSEILKKIYSDKRRARCCQSVSVYNPLFR